LIAYLVVEVGHDLELPPALATRERVGMKDVRDEANTGGRAGLSASCLTDTSRAGCGKPCAVGRWVPRRTRLRSRSACARPRFSPVTSRLKSLRSGPSRRGARSTGPPSTRGGDDDRAVLSDAGVHEEIERGRHPVASDAVLRQRPRQVVQAVRMISEAVLVLLNHPGRRRRGAEVNTLFDV